jgi:phosphatidylglycerol:prolipoprotein diacylglycerol transferase
MINPISPVAFSVFGLEIRWYALAYIAAFIVGFWLFRRNISRADSPLKLSKKQFDDLFTWIILGVIIGGRLGYVLFYNLGWFIQHPLEIFAVWHGGMSFHGGLIGVIIAVFVFALQTQRAKRKEQRAISSGTLHSALCTLDMLSVVAPIGLFFGRIANFVNMEVMGRETTKTWGVIFAGGDPIPRHPSPLYEAATEGIALFVIMYTLFRFTGLKNRAGALSGVFAILYAAFRIFCEQFRAPDAQIGFLTTWGLTMGQLLSGIMLIAGGALLVYSFRSKFSVEK